MANADDLKMMGGLAGMPSPWGMAAMGATSLLPWLFSRLGGMQDPTAQLRNQINQIMSPGAISNNANQLYRMGIQSPGFQTQLGQIAGSTNNMANLIGNRFAANNPGMDAGRRMGATMMRGNAGMQYGQAYGNLYNTSLNAANQNAMHQAQMLAGLGPSTSMSNQLFAGGINAFLPLLFRYSMGGKQ